MEDATESEAMHESSALLENSEFWNQFVGSSSANVLLMLAVGAFLGIKKLCNRDSKCKSHLHCCCIDFDVRDKTIRDPPELTDDASAQQV